MKRKKLPKNDPEMDALEIEAFSLLRKSQALREEVEELYQEIEDAVNEDIENKNWKEKEASKEKLLELDERMEENIEALFELDRLYQDICSRVNAKSGKELLKVLPLLTRKDIDPGDDTEEGEEWKKI